MGRAAPPLAATADARHHRCMSGILWLPPPASPPLPFIPMSRGTPERGKRARVTSARSELSRAREAAAGRRDTSCGPTVAQAATCPAAFASQGSRTEKYRCRDVAGTPVRVVGERRKADSLAELTQFPAQET